MKRDGHIHTPFCPHGTKDKLNAYIEKAIESGFGDISFTEHAPLPSSFMDPTPEKDSGMTLENMLPYLDAIRQAKDAYKQDILIRVGLEVDYIIGHESETRSFLEEYGSSLDDSILSVHFLRVNDEYLCMDYSSEVFMQLAQKAGSVQNVYDLYYDTVEASIAANLGQFKPKRIGHPTLVHKFQLAHGEKIDDSRRIHGVLEKIAKAGYEMDLNGAGYSKPDCLESYPPANFIPVAESLRIPLVFGSDAHSVNGLHKHYDKLYN
ncbi:histidinol-phosphatase HisJ [Planococcus shenhongbingii]|uniref:histidinol-phosphatase HisJ n=1 Tax=Planococcus shenhongbingii TaxID=3058398 RepID=UPI002627259F|nr:histidinol-phosphatase HisJ [Planococcus sp. N016]WKA59851.1 histidinol-phosphatase HisJ [Planococcus sp. N016]